MDANLLKILTNLKIKYIEQKTIDEERGRIIKIAREIATTYDKLSTDIEKVQKILLETIYKFPDECAKTAEQHSPRMIECKKELILNKEASISARQEEQKLYKLYMKVSEEIRDLEYQLKKYIIENNFNGEAK